MPYFRGNFNIPYANGDTLLALSPHCGTTYTFPKVRYPLGPYSILHSLKYVPSLIWGYQLHTRYQPMRSVISATIVSTLTCLD